MFNKEREYLNFLKKNDFIISTEDIFNLKKLDETVLNFQDWDSINYFFQKNQYAIVDNFLKENFAVRLKNFMLFTNIRSDYYLNYESVNFRQEENHYWFPVLSNIVYELKENFKFISDMSFTRAWSFIYNTISDGTAIHADPAEINFNLWVTEEESLIEKNDYNGMEIWKSFPSDEYWKGFKSYLNYTGNSNIAQKFFNEQKIDPLKVDYKFNRLIIFNSKFFHRSQPIVSKPGYENSRINYTFLFE